MSAPSHPLEEYILKTFQLDWDGLGRLALFLLAHVLVDTRLIAIAMFKEVSKGGGLSLTKIQAIADEVANGTFGLHLERVRQYLPEWCAEIAEEMNKARIALLHWKRDRFSLPEYKGQDVVTSDEGFRRCMDDVLRFIQTVPFKTPIAGGLQ